MFTGNTDNEKCNTWGLKAATIPRHVKVQHTKGVANILADSVWRLRAAGLYHNLDFKYNFQELKTPFKLHPLLNNQPIHLQKSTKSLLNAT